MKKINPFDKLIDISQAAETEWDAIIVGGGMGGSATAYRLAMEGHKVLLIEKGNANFEEGQASSVIEEELDIEKRLAGGRWPTQLQGQLNGKELKLWPAMGCGVGGSTLLYAAALHRFRSEDFSEQALPNGETISWPYTYDEIQPYYQECESLFSVRGTPDPLDDDEVSNLKAPPAMCERDQSFFQSFKQVGLNPYRLHVGYQYKPECAECGGTICDADCKKDAFNTFVIPALKSGNLFVTDQCDVEKLEADTNKVSSVVANKGGQTYHLNAKAYVLSAGGYFSSVILHKSKSDFWPQGLANSSGLVGRNLMFHICEFIALWPQQKNSSSIGPNKTIAVRDFYSCNGEKFGELQSTGMHAGYGNILYALRLLFDQSRFRKLPFIRKLLLAPALIASKILGEATIFTVNIQDFPNKNNRIEFDEASPSNMRFFYHVDEDLKQRTLKLNKLLKKRLGKLKSLRLSIGFTPNWGHPCGTCKAGVDPSNSVVDENCKFHDLDNLYVADSSFMPTSGGTNPSLTIAANALRVGDKISAKLNPSN